jgi:hypothetical protein
MVLPHVISQREDSAPWTTTICQTMHRVAIAPITDHTPTKNARNVRCDITGRPARCWMWCAGSHDLTSPLRTRASHRFHHNLNLSPQRTSPPGCAGVAPACRVHRHCARIQRYTPSPLHRMGARASSPHTAIHPITPAPPGCAGFQPACRVHRHCARIQRYTPSPLHRLGARASSPHAGCTGIAPAYSDTPHHPCTAWVRGLPARMPGAQASCPHAGCAGVAPAYGDTTQGVNSYTTPYPIVSLPGSCYTAIRSWAEACPLLSERP